MSENKKKINIGFDIGVASVGWSLIDEDHNYWIGFHEHRMSV